MQRQEAQWAVEYSRLDIKTRSKDHFNSFEEAAAFADSLSENYVTIMYPVDEDGRPIVEAISNFNL